MSDNNHTQCRNFCPIDVAKGICRLNGQFVMIDSPVCAEFDEKERCELCSHFCSKTTPGTCHGLAKPYWVDANTNAGLCDAFERN